MKIVPLNDKLVVRKIESRMQSSGGILLIRNDDNLKAVVVAVSSGYIKSGKFHNIPVNVGTIVLLNKGAGLVTDVTGEKLLLIREEDIMAVVVE